MRDYEFSLAKPNHTVRICLLGDSVSFGHGLSLMDQTYENLLESKLNNKFGVIKFEILNLSVTGYNSYQEEIVLKEKAIKFDPDIILCGFCLNDDTFNDSLAELPRETSPCSLGSELHSKLVTYLLYKLDPVGGGSDMGKVRHFFGQLSMLSQKKNFDVIILVFPYYFENIESYKHKHKHMIINDIAKKNGLKVIDFMESWKDMNPKERSALYLPDDRMHFSVLGMKQISDELFQYFNDNYHFDSRNK